MPKPKSSSIPKTTLKKIQTLQSQITRLQKSQEKLFTDFRKVIVKAKTSKSK